MALRAVFFLALEEAPFFAGAFFPVAFADGAFFFLCDLRGYLDEETFEAEDALWHRILDEANVNLTPGSVCRNKEPGFLRLCFATEPKETVVTAVRRLGKVLGS